MKKSTSVALARKLLVALWKYATSGVVTRGGHEEALPAARGILVRRN